MGFSGGVATIEPRDYKLDMEHFRAALKKRWPGIQFFTNPQNDGNFDFECTPDPAQSYRSIGATIKHRQIAWMGPLETFAEFVEWYRSYVPSEGKILCWCDDFYNHVIVMPGMTAAEILKSISGNRYFCQTAPLEGQTMAIDHYLLIRELQNQWPLAFFSWNEPTPTSERYDWFLKSQGGYLKADEVPIYFNDNDLSFIAEFAMWYRELFTDDQQLLVERRPYARPVEHLEIKLTPTENVTTILEKLQRTFETE